MRDGRVQQHARRHGARPREHRVLRPAQPHLAVRLLHRHRRGRPANGRLGRAEDGGGRRLRGADQPDDRRGPDHGRPHRGLRDGQHAVHHVRRRRQLRRLELHGLPAAQRLGDPRLRAAQRGRHPVPAPPDRRQGHRGVRRGRRPGRLRQRGHGRAVRHGRPQYRHAAAPRPGVGGDHLPPRHLRRASGALGRLTRTRLGTELLMEGLGLLEEMGELTRRGEAFALATVVWRQSPSSSQPGSRALITAEGELHGWIGGACAEPVVIREAQRVMAEGTARLLLLGTPEQFGAAVPDGMAVIPISCQSEGALEIYIEPVLPAPHLVIVGDSPMTRTLASLAGTLGWRTDLVRGPDLTPETADGRSMVVVATQGHNDEDVLERAVAARPAYLGLVGSRRRGATVLGYLADRGLPKDQLDRVRVPAGLDLGRTTHQEIAVAILAELVQLRASGTLTGPTVSTAATGSARQAGPEGTRPAPRPAQDPVCGMTVAADSSRPARYEGTDYYFCCAGCRQAFEKDPDAYVKRETRC